MHWVVLRIFTSVGEGLSHPIFCSGLHLLFFFPHSCHSRNPECSLTLLCLPLPILHLPRLPKAMPFPSSPLASTLTLTSQLPPPPRSSYPIHSTRRTSKCKHLQLNHSPSIFTQLCGLLTALHTCVQQLTGSTAPSLTPARSFLSAIHQHSHLGPAPESSLKTFQKFPGIFFPEAFSINC